MSASATTSGYSLTPAPTVRLGVSYRSGINQNLGGDADFTVPAQARFFWQQGRFVDSKVRSPVDLPDSMLFGFHHQINEDWTAAASALWTHWSRIESLTLKFSSPMGVTSQPQNWRDTWRGALGLSYRLVPTAVLRAGLAYDQSPVPGATLRSPRIPDSDRVWLTAGVTYQLFENISLHGAYAHLFFQHAPIRNSGMTGDQLIGTFSTDIDVVGVQVDWRF